MKLLKISILTLSTLLMLNSCSNDVVEPTQMMPEITGDIWTGTDLNFTKVGGTNPSDEANQDRITDNVWITMGLQGQIYNAKIEFSPNKDESPMGTEWAEGNTSDIANLTFAPFRTAVDQPRTVVGKSLVMHLIDDDIYICLLYTSPSPRD